MESNPSMSHETEPSPHVGYTPTDANTIVVTDTSVIEPNSDPAPNKKVSYLVALCLGVYTCVIVLGVLMSTSLGDPYSPKIHVQSAFLSLNDDISSAQISTLGEITFNVSKSSFSTLFDNNTKVSLFYRKQLLSTTVTDSFPHDKAVREKMAKAVFPRSSTNVKRWVSDKMAKDLNSSAPVEFSFLAKAKGSLELPGEERRGFDMTIWCPGVKLEFDAKTRVGMMAGEPLECNVNTLKEYKAQYDDPPKTASWGCPIQC